MITEETIKEMQSKIRTSIRHLNAGGCIHFAYFFSKALKSQGIGHSIFLCNQEPIDISYDYFESVSHVLVHIPKIGYIDGYDLYSTKKSYLNRYDDEVYHRHYKFSDRKLDKFRNNYRWNPAYSKRQNTKLDKIIKQYICAERRDLCEGK